MLCLSCQDLDPWPDGAGPWSYLARPRARRGHSPRRVRAERNPAPSTAGQGVAPSPFSWHPDAPGGVGRHGPAGCHPSRLRPVWEFAMMSLWGGGKPALTLSLWGGTLPTPTPCPGLCSAAHSPPALQPGAAQQMPRSPALARPLLPVPAPRPPSDASPGASRSTVPSARPPHPDKRVPGGGTSAPARVSPRPRGEGKATSVPARTHNLRAPTALLPPASPLPAHTMQARLHLPGAARKKSRTGVGGERDSQLPAPEPPLLSSVPSWTHPRLGL